MYDFWSAVVLHHVFSVSAILIHDTLQATRLFVDAVSAYIEHVLLTVCTVNPYCNRLCVEVFLVYSTTFFAN